VEDSAGKFRILKIEEFDYLLKNNNNFANKWNNIC